MRVVIPYRHANNNDLYYAIRSIQKNYALLDEIIVVGDRPPFDFDGTFIDFRDHRDKEYSIYRKLMQVKGEVLFSNDDIFFMQPVSHIPDYYKGLCGERKPSSPYYNRMYKKCSYSWKDFDCHCPMVIDTDSFTWTWGQPLKTQYGNNHGLIGEFTKDFKVNTIEEIDVSRQFLSINEPLSKYVEPLLKKLFT